MADASVPERLGPALVRAEIPEVGPAVDVVVGPPVSVVRDGQLPEAARSLPVTTLAIPTAGTWARWLSGRLDPAHHPAALTVRGPLDLDDLQHLFRVDDGRRTLHGDLTSARRVVGGRSGHGHAINSSYSS